MSSEQEPIRWWSPPGSLSPDAVAVPIKPGEKQLTWDQYAARLGNRVRQMLEGLYPDEKDLKREYSRAWLEKFGQEPSSSDPLFHPMNPDFEDRLADLGVGLNDFPQKLEKPELDEDGQPVNQEPSNDLADWLAELSGLGGSLD